jgi:ribonuclease HI
MPSQKKIERIYTDGACSGNPGAGGWGVVVYLSDGTVHELGGHDAQTTNNRMELQAAIAALHLLLDIQQSTPVTLYTDSEYVKKGITQWISGWKKKNWKTSTGKAVVNLDLWKQLDELNTSLKKQLPLTWEYVRGHAGDEGNERSDTIARAFSQKKQPALHTVSNLITKSIDPSQDADRSSPGDSSSMAKPSSKSASNPSTVKTSASEAPSSDRLDTAMSNSTTENVEPVSPSAMATPASDTVASSYLDKLIQLRNLVETFQLADVLAEQRYLVNTHELADLVGISVTTATNRGESWVWRNWRVMRVRQESNQILWQLERVS